MVIHRETAMAKRKASVDYETATRFPNNRRGNLARLQVHALEHYELACPGEPDGFAPNPPRQRQLACPICGQLRGLNDFNEEHAPQNAGHSSLGAPSCVVLSCRWCNGRSGDGYEQRAGLIARQAVKPKPDIAYVRRDLTTGAETLSRFADQSQTATDLKSAFIIAFAALGYRFAFAPALHPIRQAIYDGTAPPEGMGGPLNVSDANFAPFTVNECRPGAVVVMANDAGWLLPAGVENRLDDVTPTVSGRSLAWPRAVHIGAWLQFETLTAEGRLFHADLCPRPDHQLHGPRQARSAWKIDVEHDAEE